MLGFVLQWWGHGQCSLQVIVLQERHIPQGYSKLVRNPTGSIPTSSRVIQGNLAPPGTWSNQHMLWWENLFAYMLQGLISNAVSKIHFMVENACYWIVSTRKKCLRRMLLGDWVPWEICLVHIYLSISLTICVHSKLDNMVEVSCHILATVKRAEQHPLQFLTKKVEGMRVSRWWHLKYKEQNLLGPWRRRTTECPSLKGKDSCVQQNCESEGSYSEKRWEKW